MKFMIILFFTAFLFSLNLSAYELERLVHTHTAGILQRGEASIVTKAYNNNGLLVGAQVGLFPRFMFGVSYGGENAVGNNKPSWQESIGFQAKYRIFDESLNTPAIALGFNSQGHGSYYDDRYEIMSKGFYVSGSKNYIFFGHTGVHFGVNFSLENSDSARRLNPFVGIDKSLNNSLFFTAEYIAGIDDEENHGKGYLNFSLNLEFTDYLMTKILLYDVLQNNKEVDYFDRAIMIVYNMRF